MLDCIVKYNKPNTPPQKVMIFLHGLGATNNDLANLLSHFNINLSMKFIIPNAPIISITANMGLEMRAWYDVLSLTDFINRANTEDIIQNVNMIHQLVDKEISQGFNCKDIIIGGFSQGGLMSYYAGLTYKEGIGGVIALSTYMIPNKPIFLTTDNAKTDIFVAHGVLDEIIPYNVGKNSYQLLHDKGFNVQWNEYNMQHIICIEEIQHLNDWINKIIIK